MHLDVHGHRGESHAPGCACGAGNLDLAPACHEWGDVTAGIHRADAGETAVVHFEVANTRSVAREGSRCEIRVFDLRANRDRSTSSDQVKLPVLRSQLHRRRPVGERDKLDHVRYTTLAHAALHTAPPGRSDE